jgi:cobalt-zinc-cadmium resistance protein CzcA
VKTSCEARFRPVLITFAATVLGLAPFLIATGLGSEVQKPLAIVVIFGLFTATVMTKVVVPMMYRYFDPIHDAAHDSMPEAVDSRPNLITRMRSKFGKNARTLDA